MFKVQIGLACFILEIVHGSFDTVDKAAEQGRSLDDGPYYVLNPQKYTGIMGDDQDWATQNIPLFESSNLTLDLVYYFRWRSYRSHIHPTGNATYPWVVTEFAPDVPWAGKYNTINCAAGHHMAEAAWMRNSSVFDSYAKWWTSDESRHNYYYWWASALKRSFDKTGDTTLLKALLPEFKDQFLQYATGNLPAGGGAAFDMQNDCLWNAPGNEGQEQSLSGPGCRTLVQSMMYGEASSLAEMCDAIGDTVGAAQMQAEAARWQQRVLRLWNPAIEAFDTLRHPKPIPPPVPVPPPPAGWTEIPKDIGQFCCDQTPCTNGHSTFLFQGSASESDCFTKCIANVKCNFVTYASDGYCFNAQYCNTTNPFDGTHDVHTYSKSSSFISTTPGGTGFAGVRELASLSSPWFFQAVPHNNASAYAASWNTAFDTDGLAAPYGLRTAEKRAPGYFCGVGCCSWSGPMWPFESAKAITGAINVLNNYPSVTTLNHEKFWQMLWQYAAVHTPLWKVVYTKEPKGAPPFLPNISNSSFAKYLIHGDGISDFWVAETGCGDNQFTKDPTTPTPPAWTDNPGQGYRYNHATFMDLVLSGVVGLQPSSNGTLVVNPLVPQTEQGLTSFVADGIALHGKIVTVVFDKDGSKYNKGKGLTVLVNGVKVASSPIGNKVTIQL